MNKRIEKIIRCHWEQMIDQSYFYRGMSLKDLDLESTMVMDPSKNPTANIIPLLMEYSEFLLHLIELTSKSNIFLHKNLSPSLKASF